ncbi:E3 ubiquitin-protein ligase TRIM45-like [Ptychodera flava]|uniref:E3 ubiquitin-protein ligase TRIM45-like n=1 Tax=Ptychodera flava TaxID=63121 RepID=UPI00396A7EB7
MGSGSSKNKVLRVESREIQADADVDLLPPPEPMRATPLYNVNRPSRATPNNVNTPGPPPTPQPTIPAKDYCAFCMRKAAEYYCTDCGMIICPDCSKHHDNADILRRHTLILLGEYKEKKQTLQQYVKPLICPVHEGNELTFYCGTCSVPICMVCAEYNHMRPQHQHKTLLAGVDKRRRDLEEQVRRLRTRQKGLRTAKEQLADDVKNADEKSQMTSSLIKEHTQQLIYRLQQVIDQLRLHGDSLINEVEQKTKAKATAAEEKYEEIDDYFAKLQLEEQEVDKLVKNSNDIGFLLLVNQRLHQLKKATNEDINVEAPSDIVFIPNEVVVEAMPLGLVGALEEVSLANVKGARKSHFYEWQFGGSKIKSRENTPNVYRRGKATYLNQWPPQNKPEEKILNTRPSTTYSNSDNDYKPPEKMPLMELNEENDW